MFWTPAPDELVPAAGELAAALRRRGMVAAAAGGTDVPPTLPRVLVFSRDSALLAEQVYIAPREGRLWFWWPENKPLCPAADIEQAADMITHQLVAAR